MTIKKNKSLSQEKRQAYLKEYRKNYDKPRVTLTLSKSEHGEFSKVAEKEGVGIATVVRNMAVAYLQSIPYTPPGVEEALKEHNFLVRNIANNVNQLAHRANFGETANVHEVLAYLKQLDACVKAYTGGKKD